MTEIWKIWKETYNARWKHRIYEVSNLGRLRINNKIVNFKATKGYYMCGGSNYLHKVVANLFIPNPENKPQIDHINGNIHDNRAENLRWVTPKENMANPITRNNISKGLKGKPMPEERKIKISKTTKGRKKSPETIKRMCIAQQETQNRPEIKLQHSISMIGRHRKYNEDGTWNMIR